MIQKDIRCHEFKFEYGTDSTTRIICKLLQHGVCIATATAKFKKIARYKVWSMKLFW